MLGNRFIPRALLVFSRYLDLCVQDDVDGDSGGVVLVVSLALGTRGIFHCATQIVRREHNAVPAFDLDGFDDRVCLLRSKSLSVSRGGDWFAQGYRANVVTGITFALPDRVVFGDRLQFLVWEDLLDLLPERLRELGRGTDRIDEKKTAPVQVLAQSGTFFFTKFECRTSMKKHNRVILQLVDFGRDKFLFKFYGAFAIEPQSTQHVSPGIGRIVRPTTMIQLGDFQNATAENFR